MKSARPENEFEMNTDDFEKKLQRQPLRRVPPAWRADILCAARNAAAVQRGTRNTEHATRSFLSTLNSQLSTLLWPSPRAWAGLAALWLLMLAVNLLTSHEPATVANRIPPPSPQVLLAIQAQERLLYQSLGARELPEAERPKPTSPRPRSDRGQRTNRLAAKEHKDLKEEPQILPQESC